MTKFPWLKPAKKTDPEIPPITPVRFGNWSNGEIFMPKTAKDELMEKTVLDRAEETSRRLGIDRREFLASSMGMATCLAVINQINGCSSDDSTQDDAGKSPTGAGMCNEPGDAAFVVPTEATCEESDFLDSSGEFIFDIQTHSFDDGEWREKNPGIADYLTNDLGSLQRLPIIGAGCSTAVEPEVLDCYKQNHYADLMFTDSDTTVAVITSWPANTCTEAKPVGCGLPLSNDGMRELRDWVNNRALSQRVVNQIQVMPNDNWPLQKEIMTMAYEDPDFRAVSWKCYPAWKSDSYRPNGLPSGYFMNDEIGQAFIQHGLDLCVPNFAIHKGLSIPGFDVEHNQSIDIGPAAKMFPDANFIVYHSSINAGCGADVMAGQTAPDCSEAVPYDPDDPQPRGLNQLIRSMQDNDIGPNENVYGELGTAWQSVMTDTSAAQHFIGKLLLYIGEDNICWGTDSILVGSPQLQITQMRSFQITQQYQEMYGYPALTPERKAKLFGLNAARIFRVDPDLERCNADASMFAGVKRTMDGELGPRRWTVKPPLGPRTRREYMQLARMKMAKAVPI